MKSAFLLGKRYTRIICFSAAFIILHSLWGCEKRTTIILPSEVTSSVSSTQGPTTAATVPTTAAVIPTTTEATIPATNPSVPLPTEKPIPTQTTTPPTESETTPACYDISTHTVGSLEYALIDEINHYRAEAGLPALSLDTKLCALSAIRAYECSGNWGHTRPDGRSYSTVLSDYAYSIRQRHAENLLTYSGSYTASDLTAVWINSDTHRENILSADFICAGLGVYRSGSTYFVVCLFAG